MIAVDTNLLVYAHRQDSEWHAEAAEALRALAEGRGPWAIPWPCVHEFLAVVTHARIYKPPTTTKKALDQVSAWLESPSLVLLSEGPGYAQRMADVLATSKVRGAKVHDARIAALCLHHDVQELWSADRDFSRFKGVEGSEPTGWVESGLRVAFPLGYVLVTQQVRRARCLGLCRMHRHRPPPAPS